MDLFDTLDAPTREALAAKALEGLMAPLTDWLQIHQSLEIKDELPSEHHIEAELDAMEAFAYTDDGQVSGHIDAKAARSFSRDIGHRFKEAQGIIETAQDTNAEAFLGALTQSVEWSVRHRQVDHPELQVDEWMKMANGMDLALEAREVLMKAGGPAALGRWWTHVPDVSHNWNQAFRVFDGLVCTTQCSHASEWLEPLLSSPIETLTPPVGTRRYGAVRKEPDPDAMRRQLMGSMWAKLVSRSHSGRRGGLSTGVKRIIDRLGAEGMEDFTQLDWEILFQDRKRLSSLASTTELQERLTSLFSTYPDAYHRWMSEPEDAKDTNPLPDSRKFVETDSQANGKRMSLFEVHRALDGGGPHKMEAVMERLDRAAQENGLETGYASALMAAHLSMSLDKAHAARPKVRM